MKKIFCMILICFCFLILSGCNGIDNIVLNNMSDLRINYFEGNNDYLYATLSCGKREDVFAYDGTSMSPIECGVLSVGFYELHSYSAISVMLEVDGVETEYILEKSPYEEIFMEDIGKILTGENQVSLRLKNQVEEIVLNEISSEWQIDFKEAIKIGSDFFKEEIRSLYFNSTFNAECYLKIVSKIDYENKYWYFSIIDKSGQTYSLLIDVNTGEIINNKIKKF